MIEFNNLGKVIFYYFTVNSERYQTITVSIQFNLDAFVYFSLKHESELRQNYTPDEINQIMRNRLLNTIYTKMKME